MKYNRTTTDKNTTNFPSFRQVRPKARSVWNSIKQALFSYNYAVGRYTSTGKELGKPLSKELVQQNMRCRRFKSLSKTDWQQHLEKQKIFYVYNNGSASNPYILVMIDVDLLDKKLDVSAIVDQELGSKIFWEKSPSGNMHGYLFVGVEGYACRTINKALTRLNDRLKSLVYKYDWTEKIKELVVKGKPHTIRYVDGSPVVDEQFALYQLPLEAENRKEEFFDTSMMNINHILEDEFVTQTRLNFEVCVKVRKPETGSTSFCFLSDRLEELPKFRQIAAKLPELGIKLENRAVISREDFSIFMFIVHELQQVQDHMPHRQIQRIWQELYANGYVDRAYCSHRATYMRRFLGSIGGIEYFETNYYVGYVDQQGEYQKGKAAEWCLSDALLRGELSCETTGGDLCCSTSTIILSPQDLPPDLVQNFYSEVQVQREMEEKLILYGLAA